MNTTKGVARAVARSPRSLAYIAAGTGVVTLILGGILRSQSLLDDCMLAAAIWLVAWVVFLQSDWALPALERLRPEVVWRIPTEKPIAALTIDDVPLLARPTAFEEILDVLKSHGVKATLFIMSGFRSPEEEGGLAPEARQRCMDLLRRAVAEGHELANHLKFDYPAVAMLPEDFDRAFEHCDALLAELSGGEAKWRSLPMRWFRPASAMWSEHILATAKRRGYMTVIGNCYPHDVASISRFWTPGYLRCRARPGSVIIVHDRWHTPATLSKALPAIRERGLQMVTLSELHAAAAAEDL